MTFKPTFTCDRTQCTSRERVIYCFNYSKYPFKKCHFYNSPVAIPELRTTDGLEHDLNPSKLEENRRLES